MGSISVNEFNQFCSSLVEASHALRDSWQIIKHQQGFYLTKKFVKLFDFSKNQTSSEIEILIECHVVYSSSYANPVFYFSACKLDGEMLKLEECWNMIEPTYPLTNENKWTFLTQTEHPLLLQPYFQIHPCHTSDFMKFVDSSQTSSNYIFSWLSIILPVLQLDLQVDAYLKFFSGQNVEM